MNRLYIDIGSLAISLFALILACYSWRKTRRLTRNRDLLIEKFKDSTERFANWKRSAQQVMDNLKQQNDKSLSLWDQAQAELQFKDKQMSELLGHYKKIKTQLQDKTVLYDQLAGKYNALLDKTTYNGDMPV